MADSSTSKAPANYFTFKGKEGSSGALYKRKARPLSPDHKGSSRNDSPSHRKFPSLYPGISARVVDLSPTDVVYDSHSTTEHRLGEFISTAICGNDILSSLLFVSALTAIEAGIWAPVAQVLVVFTLWLYKGVYSEVLSALPMNGGCFNVLLHTTSKGTATIAACFSILSYVATCVCSGTSAIYYLHELFPGIEVMSCTVLLLSAFAFLNLMGISESGTVALIIFSVHTLTLSLLVLFSLIYVTRFGFGTLVENWKGYPPEPILPDGTEGFVQRGFMTSVFFGYGTAMLGVSGFESSSQFIEEQKEGVFPKTLNNMWLSIACFNPLIMFLALCVFPLPDIATTHKSVLLSAMGREVAGDWLHDLVSIDAFLVLAGAVLTAFVGVTGLVRRLALERCMPEWLLMTNPCRGTNHNIILGFLGICVSMFLILNARVEDLSEMYSVCFLSLLLMFGAGHMMMRVKRSQLPRNVQAPMWTVVLAMCLVAVAFVAVIRKNPGVVPIFCLYFSVTLVLAGAMFFRMSIMKLLLRIDAYHDSTKPTPSEGLRIDIKHDFSSRDGTTRDSQREGKSWFCVGHIKRMIKKANKAPVVFFTKQGNVVAINKAVLYIRRNENTNFIKIVHFSKTSPSNELRRRLAEDIQFLDRLYPKFCIDLVYVNEDFSPAAVRRLAKYLDIPVNRMFIGCPSKSFHETVASLGGVRVITH